MVRTFFEMWRRDVHGSVLGLMGCDGIRRSVLLDNLYLPFIFFFWLFFERQLNG